MGDLSISTQGAEEWRRLAKKLRDAGEKELRANLRKRIRAAAKPVLNEVKSSALQLPSHHAGGGLRQNLARGVKLSTTNNGVKFVAQAKPFGPKGSTMPKDVDKGRWRHPVFGNRHNWVSQTMPPGWFTDPLRKSAPQFRRAVLQAMDDTAREIEGR